GTQLDSDSREQRRAADQHSSHYHGPHEPLAHADHAEDGRLHPATGDAVHAADLFDFLLQFRSGLGIILHDAEPVHDSAALPEPEATGPGAGKSCAGREEKRTTMTPKE